MRGFVSGYDFSRAIRDWKKIGLHSPAEQHPLRLPELAEKQAQGLRSLHENCRFRIEFRRDV
jgi:hypothetical protein